jgi:hypothetical protein
MTMCALNRTIYSECLFISLQHRGPERHINVVFMPLSDDGERVNQILVTQVFLHIDHEMRRRPFLEPRPFKEVSHVLL